MSQLTSWSLILEASRGAAHSRDEFARRYVGPVRAYLGERWKDPRMAAEIDDAVQEVFLECFRDGGALAHVAPERAGGFRAYLYGLVRNVALRAETRRARGAFDALVSDAAPEAVAREQRPSEVFDREWARTLMREAVTRQRARAEQADESARRRVELLRLRFHENLPVREIAKRWAAAPETLHRELAKAQSEFKEALLEVVAGHTPGPRQRAELECERLLEMLG